MTGHPTGYRGLSLWLDTAGEDLVPRPSLDRDLTADVVIVGGGYTGLWTAYYLARALPRLRIVVLEAEIAGFGASGRNGGWCSALLAASRERIAAMSSRAAAVALQRALLDTVDEVGRVVASEGIDCHWAKGGTLTLARSRAQVLRLQEAVRAERAWGFGEEHYRWYDRAAAAGLVDADGVLGAAGTPHCAAVHPARLARGLATACERRGVQVYERSPVVAIGPRRVHAKRARVRADVVIRATEGYTARLPGLRRALLPIYSLMIATEPLPASFWQQVGWRRRETLTDGRHLLIYAQRTADDRIAFGGRGAPYHYGSRVEPGFDRDERVHRALHEALVELFPAARGAAVTHRWGGALGAPRDWTSYVRYDRASGLGTAGGYVGDGVGAANLAGRTLADLVLGRDTELVHLPWVGHRPRRWEPEPLRWLGVNAGLALMDRADRAEQRTGRPSRLARLAGAYLGH
ncbi:MAG: NAD(P)/FAD-dependent oxidoreductase [Frankiaceae bacterium]